MESPLKRVLGSRPDLFTSIVVAASIISFASGLVALMALQAPLDDDIGAMVAMVQILFSMLCLSLVLLVRVRGTTRTGGLVFIVSLAITCLFLIYSGGAGVVWFIVLPPIATTILGKRRGGLASLYFALAAFFLLFVPLNPAESSPFDRTMPFALVYAAVAVLTFLSCSDQEASGTGEAGVRGDDLVSAEVDGSPILSRPVPPSDTEEIVVFYREDALATIENIPHPEAVFSYLLLEGMGAPRLTEKEAPPERSRDGDYLRRSFSIDDLLSKVESVIDVREAKKLMEFNKIQSQIDSILTHDSDDESGFERLCFQNNLSEREAAVAKCILKGATNKEISTELFISVETVKTHVKNVLKKCDINSRIDFIKLFSKF